MADKEAHCPGGEEANDLLIEAVPAHPWPVHVGMEPTLEETLNFAIHTMPHWQM